MIAAATVAPARHPGQSTAHDAMSMVAPSFRRSIIH
jgi:hypothetical protein